MLLRPRIFTLSVLSLALFSRFSFASDLNLDFLQGTNVVPSILNTASRYPAGQYYIDVVVNKENIGKAQLNISPEEDKADVLCLSQAWLKAAGVPVRLDNYTSE
ncbi:FimD/PapC N-terminal domain-containing protein, partial [Yersinia wautersii]